MFLYEGSGLKEDIQELKKNINKPEYEKIIEPYQERINKLEMEIYDLKKASEALFSAAQLLIKSLDHEYLKIIVEKEEPRAYFSTSPFAPTEDVRFERINVPIKMNIREDFLKIYGHFYEQYEKRW